MKMTKKKAALFAVFAVAVVALAGVGYAVAYTSSVTTTGTLAASNVYSLMTSNGVAAGSTVTDSQTVKITYDTTRSGNDDPNYYFNSADPLYIGFKIEPTNEVASPAPTYSFKMSAVTFTTLPGNITASWSVVNADKNANVIASVTPGNADGVGTLSANTVYYLKLTLSATDPEDPVTSVSGDPITISAITLTAVRL